MGALPVEKVEALALSNLVGVLSAIQKSSTKSNPKDLPIKLRI